MFDFKVIGSEDEQDVGHEFYFTVIPSVITKSVSKDKRDGDGDGKIYDGTKYERAASSDVASDVSDRGVLAWARQKFGDDKKAANFTAWFGRSKAIDVDGSPLVMYHGTQDRSKSASKAYDVIKAAMDRIQQPEYDSVARVAASNIPNQESKLAKDLLAGGGSARWAIRQYLELVGPDYGENPIRDIIPKDQNPFDFAESHSSELTEDEKYWLDVSSEFQIFDRDKLGGTSDDADAKMGFFFTPDRNFAGQFTYKMGMNPYTGETWEESGSRPGVIAVYLSVENPLDLRRVPKGSAVKIGDALGIDPADIVAMSRSVDGSKSLQKIAARRVNEIQSKGYDGVINRVKDRNGKESVEFIVFNPSQIKSTDNAGSFSKDSQDITKSTVSIKDGDGDGRIHDGTPQERTASSEPVAPDDWNESRGIHDWAERKFGDKQKAENFAGWFGDSKVKDADGNPLVVYHGTTKDFSEFDSSKHGTTTDEGLYGPGFYFSDYKGQADDYAGSSGKVIAAYVSMQKPFDIDAAVLDETKVKSLKDAIGSFDYSVAGRKYPGKLAEKVAAKAKEASIGIIDELGFYEDKGSIAAHSVYSVMSEKLGKDLVNKILSHAGYDGIAHKNRGEHSPNVWIAFKPEQIKSVDNEGTFDTNSKDIRKSMRPDIRDGDGDGKIYDGEEWERAASTAVMDVDESDRPVYLGGRELLRKPQENNWSNVAGVIVKGEPLFFANATDEHNDFFSDLMAEEYVDQDEYEAAIANDPVTWGVGRGMSSFRGSAKDGLYWFRVPKLGETQVDAIASVASIMPEADRKKVHMVTVDIAPHGRYTAHSTVRLGGLSDKDIHSLYTKIGKSKPKQITKGLKPEIVDGDGDGKIYDGTKDERAAVDKAKAEAHMRMEMDEKSDSLARIAGKDRDWVSGKVKASGAAGAKQLVKLLRDHIDKAPAYRLTMQEYLERERVKEIDKLKKERYGKINKWDDMMTNHRTGSMSEADIKWVRSEGVLWNNLDDKEREREMQEAMDYDTSKRYSRRIRLLESDQASNWAGTTMEAHAKYVARALKAGKDVPDDVLRRYVNTPWMPVERKEVMEINELRAGVDKAVAQFRPKVKSEYAKYEAVRDQMDEIRKQVIGEFKSLEEMGRVAEDAMEKAAHEGYLHFDELRAISNQYDSGRDEVLSLPEDNPDRIKYETHWKQYRHYADLNEKIGDDHKENIEGLRQRAWKIMSADGLHTTVRLNGTSYNRKNEAEAIDFLQTVLNRDAHGLEQEFNVKTLTKNDPYGEFRAYYGESDRTIHIQFERESTWTIVHEIAHGIEINAGLADTSKAFVVEQSKANKSKHLGKGYEKWEIHLPDGFINDYSGKWYHHDASEVVSVGLEQMYLDPAGFAQKAPEHFNYVLGVVRGDIRGSKQGEKMGTNAPQMARVSAFINRAFKSELMKKAIKDADGDGRIYDGTKWEQAAPARAAVSPRGTSKPAAQVDDGKVATTAAVKVSKPAGKVTPGVEGNPNVKPKAKPQAKPKAKAKPHETNEDKGVGVTTGYIKFEGFDDRPLVDRFKKFGGKRRQDAELAKYKMSSLSGDISGPNGLKMRIDPLAVGLAISEPDDFERPSEDVVPRTGRNRKGFGRETKKFDAGLGLERRARDMGVAPPPLGAIKKGDRKKADHVDAIDDLQTHIAVLEIKDVLDRVRDGRLSARESGLNWYGDDFKDFMSEYSDYADVPELKDPKSSEYQTMVFVLAATSIEQALRDNLRVAQHIFRKFRDSGYKKMPRIAVEDGVKGAAKNMGAMNHALGSFNKVMESEGGLDGAIKFFNSEHKVRDLVAMGFEQPAMTGLNEKVLGANVIGPKIGMFFSNMNGHNDEVTLDIWQMRVNRRNFGNLANYRSDQVMDRAKELLEYLPRMEEEDWHGRTPEQRKSLEAEIRKIAKTGYVEFGKGEFEDFMTESNKVYGRKYKWGSEKKNMQMHRNPKRTALKHIKDKTSFLNDGTMNKTEQTIMKRSLAKAVKILSAMGYTELERVGASGAQAIQWMKEKRIWKALGVRDKAAGDYSAALKELVTANKKAK